VLCSVGLAADFIHHLMEFDPFSLSFPLFHLAQRTRSDSAPRADGFAGDLFSCRKIALLYQYYVDQLFTNGATGYS
jgi:hypothetical protein